MTLDELLASTAMTLTPAQVASVLGSDAQGIRVAARLHPERLGFSVIVIGHRTRIPRKPFLDYVMGEVRHGDNVSADRQP